MSFVTYSILLTSLLLGLLVSLNVHAEEGNSTYNFYFQKAPGPVTVNQGGAPAVPTQLPPASAVAPVREMAAPAPAPAASSVAPVEETQSRKKFYLSLGYAMGGPLSPASRYENVTMEKPEYLSGQYGIKGELDITDQWAVTGEVYKLKREVGLTHGQPFVHADKSVMNSNQLPLSQRKVEKSVIDFSIGAAYNLVRLKSTTLSILGGLTTTPFIRYENISPTNSSGGYAVPVSVDHEKSIYVGSRLRLIADGVWGLDLSGKYLLGSKVGIAQLGLTFAI